MKWPARLLAVLISAILVLFTYVPVFAEIPPGTPGGTVCKATLGRIGCAAFQKMLAKSGLKTRVIAGELYATVNSLKRNTYIAVLACVNSKDFIFIVRVKVTGDKFEVLDVKPTNKRYLKA